MKRQRKISGSTFAKILITEVQDNPFPSYTDLSQNAASPGVDISSQRLEQRFTREAARFIQEILSRLAEGETAALKLQVRLNYATSQLEVLALQSGRQHDRSTPYGPEREPAGSLHPADLGYFSLAELRQRQEQGQYFLTRYKTGTALYTPEGAPLDLLQWLTQEVTTEGERLVLPGIQEHIQVRLMAFRVPQEEVERRRRRLREYARKKGVTPKRETLLLTEWTILLTNAPEEKMTPSEALVLARVRWQVEILFRVWKSHAHVDEWQSQNPWRTPSELYARLAGQVILNWILLTEWHRFPDRSLFKAARLLQKLAIPPALCLRQGKGLREITSLFRECSRTCRVNKRRGKSSTFQRLLALECST